MKDYADEFEENGFCIIRNAIDLSLINVANEQIDKFTERNRSLIEIHGLFVDGMLQRVVNLHLSISSFRDIFSEAMNKGHKVCDSYGKATLYTSLFFELGSQQSLHRDTPYFYSGGQGGYMGVWVALDDVDENNGALVAVAGSHKLSEPDLSSLKNKFYPDSEVPPSSTPLFNAYNNELVALAEKAGLATITCSVMKGDMIIWNPSTLHGGLPHRDKTRTRRSFVMHITPKDMPMKHMDYFFHREKPIQKINKSYVALNDGRLISEGDVIDFRHIKSFRVKELGRF